MKETSTSPKKVLNARLLLSFIEWFRSEAFGGFPSVAFSFSVSLSTKETKDPPFQILLPVDSVRLPFHALHPMLYVLHLRTMLLLGMKLEGEV